MTETMYNICAKTADGTYITRFDHVITNERVVPVTVTGDIDYQGKHFSFGDKLEMPACLAKRLYGGGFVVPA